MAKKRKPSKPATEGCLKTAVAGLILLIGLAQAAGGIGTLAWAMKAAAHPADWRTLAVSTLFAVLFGSIGFGLLAGLVIERRRFRVAVLADWPADEPWRARADWASGQISAAGNATVVAPVLAVVSVWWIAASLPLVSVMPVLLRQADSRWAWLTLLIPAAGLLPISAFLHQFFAARKFGESVFQMASVPGVVGGQLAGVLRIPRVVRAVDGFRVTLTCVERQVRRKQEAQEVALWQDERLVTATLGDELSGETAVPVLLAIPYEACETSRPDSRRDIRWRLDVWARLPGVDYKSRFEVPVFKTAASRRDFQLDAGLTADYAAPPNNDLLLREAGVRKEPLAGDGVRLVFTAARNWPSALVVSAFVAVFGGIFAVIGPNAVPLVPRVILAALVLAFLWVALDLWFYRSVVEATRDELTIRGGLFGIGRTRSLAADEIKRFKSEEYMSSGSYVWKNVCVVPRVGKQHTVAKGIHSRLVERAVIDELNAALGRE
jgi:hypothetical protein